MSKISSGILGGFSGKVGNVVGAKWKGIDTMKIKASSVTNPKTPAQQDQRLRFATILGFLKPMTDFLRVGFKIYSKGMTQFNAAMSYNLQNAISGTYPNYVIDYASALVSRGNLAMALNAVATSTTSGEVEITWDDNSGIGSATSSDKAMIMVYVSNLQAAIFSTADVDRYVKTTILTVPTIFTGEDAQIFLGFISSDGTKVSNSTFLGTITLA